jgi:anti-sigma factor RsiW
MKNQCAAPLALTALVDYWFGELPSEREEAIEEHLFACAHCSRALEELAALGAGIRAAFRGGMVRAVVSRGFVDAIKAQGLRLREYRVPAGGSVNCTIGAADDFVISRLEAPLAGVQRVDVVVLGAQGEAQATFEDIPFDAGAGEVLLCPSAASLKQQPAFTARFRLVAVDGGGKKALGEYTFVHTPS